MQLRGFYAAGQLRRSPLAGGGDCTLAGGNGARSRANARAFARQLA